MTFLIIASFPDSLLRFRGSLIDTLRNRGLKVHVAAPNFPSGSDLRDQLEARGVQVHDIPLRRTGINPMADLALLFHLWRLIRRIQPKYVLGYTIKPVIYGSIAARLARIRHCFALITGLGYAFTSEVRGFRRLLRILVQHMYSNALSGAEKVFFQNPDDEALFRSLGILAASTPTVVVNGSGVDIKTYNVTPFPSAPRFLLIARLLGNKGVREYVEAARQVRTQYPEVLFNLVGWIDDNPDAIKQQELEEWQTDGTIVFLGRLHDVRPAIAECSAYVLPSYREGTPRTVLEAMAMGRPIITTDAPGCRETVRDGENGILVTVGSVDELVHAMMRFINEPKMAARMGQCSRQIIEDKYDVDKVNVVLLREMGIS